MRLVIFLIITISINVHAQTPSEFCMRHVDFDELFETWKHDQKSKNNKKMSDQEFVEIFSKYYSWSMENYFSCRNLYENICKTNGKAEVRGWYSGKVQERLDYSAFK